MISRNISIILEKLARQLPVIAILGPRQSGKTTIAHATFSRHKYITLEELDIREQAIKDPREFLEFNRNEHGLILDEIQHAPDLLSYIQTIVDLEEKPGYFILTGSQNFIVNQTISQTLAGRMAVFTLLPLSINELQKNNLLPGTIEEYIVKGSYPRLYDKEIDRHIWYSSYILNYIERDVRQIATVENLSEFHFFLKMCAGRIGQELNISALANDCGIPAKKIEKWLSLLQTSYIMFLLRPHYTNFGKRLVKSPKLYFFDTGVACSLLNIETVEQLQTHYLRGALCENLIIADFNKQSYNLGREPNIYFWRDNHGLEVDCIIERGQHLIPVEIKSGRTVTSDYFVALEQWNKISKTNPENNILVYAGKEGQQRSLGRVYTWKEAGEIVSNLF